MSVLQVKEQTVGTLCLVKAERMFFHGNISVFPSLLIYNMYIYTYLK